MVFGGKREVLIVRFRYQNSVGCANKVLRLLKEFEELENRETVVGS